MSTRFAARHHTLGLGILTAALAGVAGIAAAARPAAASAAKTFETYSCVSATACGAGDKECCTGGDDKGKICSTNCPIIITPEY